MTIATAAVDVKKGFPNLDAGTPGDVAAIDALAINTIRTLSMDAVQAANSGHPGTPMALAPVAYALWQRVLNFDPADPRWPGRDRFVLSNGHASMLLYSMLHLSGTQALDKDLKPTGRPAVSIDDVKGFRQMHTRCRVTPSTDGRRVSRPRPGRSARAWPTPLAWRWPRSGWPPPTTGRDSSCSTIASTPSAATAA